MAKSYAVLPCNGLDKCAGQLAREVALRLMQDMDSEIICPVLYHNSDSKYQKILAEKPLLVIDGCATRCASKLAAAKGVKISQKITITEEAKARGLKLGKSLRLGENELKLATMIVGAIGEETVPPGGQAGSPAKSAFSFPQELDYETFAKDKFTFRLPKGDFFYNENDCWAYICGNKARIGVTDYAQKSLADIIFFTPPALGAQVEQFGELGEIESGKAVFEVISPVAGKVTAVNEKLNAAPELINEDPYEEGWIAEVEIADFTEDRQLLYTFEQYLPIMKRKVNEFHV